MNFKTKTVAAGILAVLTVAAAAFVILPRHKKTAGTGGRSGG